MNEPLKVSESRGYWSKTNKITRDMKTNPFHPNNFPKISMAEFERSMADRKKTIGFVAKELETVEETTDTVES